MTGTGGTLAEFLRGGAQVAHHRPWLRAEVDAAAWRTAAEQLAAGLWSLTGLWGEPEAVHMALLDNGDGTFGVATLACPNRAYPSVALLHPPAMRLERAVQDLFGLHAEGLPDPRPWLDHGRWGVRNPGGADGQVPVPAAAPEYAFLAAEGGHLHQIPVGPVHAGIIEPGHFRFTADGETVVRLEERLGYTHKGVELLMRGATPERAARLAGRVSGDSVAAYGLAFARAVEAALAVEPPARAVWLRALMAEMERIANHLGDIGAVCNDASFAIAHALTGILRERILRSAHEAFGHRLLRDCIVPGGVAADLDAGGVRTIRAAAAEVERRFPEIVRLVDDTATLKNRTFGTGVLSETLARRYAAGGYIGRASGRAFDARRTPGYPPYDLLRFDVPVVLAGDVNARVWIRIQEVVQSLALIGQMLDGIPGGPVCADLPAPRGTAEGVALVEGFRGDVLAWVRLGAGGAVERAHLRDPSWFQWPLLEAVIEGNIVADFPLCNKSFNCSYSGHDL